jgi:hypothetical protein
MKTSLHFGGASQYSKSVGRDCPVGVESGGHLQHADRRWPELLIRAASARTSGKEPVADISLMHCYRNLLSSPEALLTAGYRAFSLETIHMKGPSMSVRLRLFHRRGRAPHGTDCDRRPHAQTLSAKPDSHVEMR